MERQQRQFIRLKQLKALVGLGHTTIYAKIKTGEFPKPYPLGARAVAWLSSEIDDWIAQRVAAGRQDEALNVRS